MCCKEGDDICKHTSHHTSIITISFKSEIIIINYSYCITL